MKLLIKILKPFKLQLFFLMFLFAIQTLCALFIPYVMSLIVENGIRETNMEAVYIYSIIMVALAVVALGCALAVNYLSPELSSKAAVYLRRMVFEKVNTLSSKQFSDIGTGSLITRTTDDISWMEDVISNLPYVIVAVPIMFIGGVALSALGDWFLAAILLAASIIVLLIAIFITSKLEKYWLKGDEYNDMQNRIIRERLKGIRVIRAFDKEEFEHERAAAVTTEMCKAYVRSNTVSNLVSPIISLFLNLATVAVIYVGAVRIGKVESLKAGDVIATIQYIALIINAILIMAWAFAFIPHLKVSMGRITEVLDMESNYVPSTGEKLKGDIKFEHVDFSYSQDEKKALIDLSLDIPEGEIVGIIGGTGSGKSTLIKLIMDLYGASGKRSFGGKDYDELNSATVRDNVSIALQKSMIFEGTVEENVKIGCPEASEQDVLNVLEIAQLSTFLERHEGGIKYELKQAGNNISGGQKQRINIARTILKPASVYIFDDSFSALDYLTESNLRKALNKYLEGKTQIVVTQRVATAMRCNKVYVMDKGRIVGVGTNEELLKSCPIYKEIYDSQLGGENE